MQLITKRFERSSGRDRHISSSSVFELVSPVNRLLPLQPSQLQCLSLGLHPLGGLPQSLELFLQLSQSGVELMELVENEPNLQPASVPNR
ncbi:hypothetical protein EYF80_017205 [Liparis tanakae]|uniref:Uncharacterized protein n=1 Tax=Liparis tanakae TaxID=230148 RepID=A0A4Z2I3S9_9TELE|nr:hypothetical protein EYF80_017205 [Liparis tanakae]